MSNLYNINKLRHIHQNFSKIDNPELEDTLTNIRDYLFLFVNPMIKYVLSSANEYEFKKYGFNSCRQTAIFTSYILKEKFNISINALEINMNDSKFEQNYLHCVNLGTIKNKDKYIYLTIDMSRTINPLLFWITNTPIDSSNFFYPKVDNYKFIKPLYVNTKFNIEENINNIEYFTGRKAKDVCDEIMNICDIYYSKNNNNAPSQFFEIYKNYAPYLIL